MSALQSPMRVHGDNIYVRHSNLMLEVGTGDVWWLKIRTTCLCVLWCHQNYNYLLYNTVRDCCPLALSGSVCMSVDVCILSSTHFQFSVLSVLLKRFWLEIASMLTVPIHRGTIVFLTLKALYWEHHRRLNMKGCISIVISEFNV